MRLGHRRDGPAVRPRRPGALRAPGAGRELDTLVKLRTYIVEDNATIRENLIGTLEELASVEAVGIAETEDDGKTWLANNGNQWDLAIVDLFLRQGSGLGVLAAAVWRARCSWRRSQERPPSAGIPSTRWPPSLPARTARRRRVPHRPPT